MGIQRNPEPGRQAVLWLATAFVILMGAGSCTFIILSVMENPTWHLLVLSGMMVGIILLLVRMGSSRETKTGKSWLRLWMALRGKSDPKTVLRVGRKKNAPGTPYGTNAPPTLESVREAADQNISWVPHGPPPDRPQRPH